MTRETLLNKLIDLGWNAFGEKYQSGQFILDEYSLNDLCSIDSGLWQFVCEKRLYDRDKYYQEIKKGYVFTSRDYEYRLMLSSIQEDKQQFLLDNIILPDVK